MDVMSSSEFEPRIVDRAIAKATTENTEALREVENLRRMRR